MEFATIALMFTIAMLAAIVYSLRVLVLMERRISRMEKHLEKVVNKIMKREKVIEKKVAKKYKK